MPGGCTCHKCGTALASDATDGFCPVCVLEDALRPAVCNGGAITEFGDYELIEEIARGGMGIVYKARQKSLDRIVALKLLLFGQHSSPDIIRRFRVEAVAAGSLQHPNIVAIHEVGIHNGQHFLVMDFVDGPNLGRLVHGQPMSPKRAAAYVKTIAEAVHYSHERGILHRDLKPSNVLIDANDQPRVTDFGLARRIEGDSSLTLTGQIIGSPTYMPPEQAAGCCNRGRISRASDVYGLGAILYYLLTGRPPLQGETIADTLHRVVNAEPLAPRLLNPAVPVDLQTICLKCLQKEPERRYATASELASELERFLRGEPVRARPVTRAEKAWRWCRRKPALAAAMSVAVSAILVSVLLAVQARRVEKARMADRRQSAINKALLAASSGDFEATEAALRDAELFGASGGEIRMLRGQLAFHRSEFEQAVQELQQAVRLRPGSVATRAMLVTALNRVGKWHSAEATLHALSDVPPERPEDYLFKGLAEAEYDPVRGLATVDEGVRRRPSALARLIRARVRLYKATYTGDSVDVEAAVSDANVAQELLPGNLTAIITSLFANLYAAGAYADARQSGKLEAALRQAALDTESLKRFPTNQYAIVARIKYLEHLGYDQNALDELRRAHENVRGLLLDYFYASALYRHGRFENAMDVMGRTSAGKEDVAYLYMLLEAPDGPEHALTRFSQVWRVSHSVVDSAYYQVVLRLLGRTSEAVAKCRSLREQSTVVGIWRGGWFHHLMDFNCGELKHDALLKLAGASRWNQCEAHFHIAIHSLAQGDRNRAREHFEKALATRVSHAFDYEWSSMFLSRMARDPNWPPWIPAEFESSE